MRRLPPVPALAYPGPMTAADLVEIALIERLKYRYMRCLDQKLWDEMAECLAADAVAAYSGGKYTFYIWVRTMAAIADSTTMVPS